MKGRTVLIIIAILVGLCICICACGAIAFTQAGRIISSAATTDPVKAATVAQGITDYTLPQGYKESSSLDIFGVSMAMISSADSQQTILLIQMPAGVQISQAQIEQEFRQFANQSGNNTSSMTSVGTRTVTIRGQSTEMAIYESTDSSGSKVHEEIGTFQGKNGTAFLMILAPADNWDQTSIDSFIASMK